MDGDNKKPSEEHHFSLDKGKQPLVQDKDDKNRVKTVVPDNDSGKPGAPADNKPDKK